MILPDCKIGEGAIVGAGSIVTSDIEKYAIAVGTPARVVRRHVSWSRELARIAPKEMEMLKAFSVNDNF